MRSYYTALRKQTMSKRFSKQAKEKAKAMRAAGMTYVAIAKELGCSPPCVRYWCDPKGYAEVWDRESTRRAKKEASDRVDSQAMQLLFIAAREITETTGVPHDVDHIIPIHKGGEHTLSNLRIIPRWMNRTGAPVK